MPIAEKIIEQSVLPYIELYVDNINKLAEKDMIHECEIWIKAIEGIRQFLGLNEVV